MPYHYPLSAGTDGAAGSAEFATVFLDDGMVTAFLTWLADHGRLWLRRSRSFRFISNYAHRVNRQPVFGKDAKHRIPVNDEACDLGHRRWVIFLAVRTRHTRQEVASRLGIIQQLAQLHSNPGRVNNAHIQAQQLAQAVECHGVFAR